MGVQHFYLYYNGPIGAMLDDDPPAARALLRDPRVTLVQWNFQMWQTGAYRNVGDRPCVGHFAQMMSFNDAYLRFRHQHKYMGFFDFDEFLVVHKSRLRPLLARADGSAGEGGSLARPGASPLMSLLWSHGFPLALSFMNRWGAVLPPIEEGSTVPLTPESVSVGHAFYGAHSETGRSRSKVGSRLCALGGAHPVLARRV